MRFLVDAQLPPALARHLVARGFSAAHGTDLGFGSAPDSVIWRHAEAVRAAVITRDEDSRAASFRLAAARP